jgi:hypothetical protein
VQSVSYQRRVHVSIVYTELLGKTFPLQPRIIGSVVFCAVRVVTTENRRLVLLITSCLSSALFIVLLIPHSFSTFLVPYLFTIPIRISVGLVSQSVTEYCGIFAQSKNCGVTTAGCFNTGTMFSTQFVPMAAHATTEYFMSSLSNNYIATKERCSLRGPCQDVINRTSFQFL